MITKTSATGSADNEVLYTSQEVYQFNEHYFESLDSGSFTVQVSLDGANWTDDVNLTSMGGISKLAGVFRKVRVLQDGATAAQARIAHVQTAES